MIYSVDSQPPMSQVATFHQKGTAMVGTFIDILTGINKVRRQCRFARAPHDFFRRSMPLGRLFSGRDWL